MSTPRPLPAELSELLLALYQGPLQQKLFNAFLLKLRDALGGNFATLILRAPRAGDRGLVLNAVVLPEAEHAYTDTYFALDPFVDLPASGEVVTLSELMPHAELRKSVYFQEYMQPVNVYQIIGTDIVEPGGFRARLRVTRPRGAARFGRAEKALIASIIPHLQQALALHARLVELRAEREIYAEAVEHMEVGSIILDEHGRVRSMNHAARQIVAAGNGLVVQEGALQVGGRTQQGEFRRLVEEVLDAHRRRTPTTARALRLERPGGRAPLGLVIRPAPVTGAADDAGAPSVAIFISDPERSLAPPAAHWCSCSASPRRRPTCRCCWPMA